MLKKIQLNLRQSRTAEQNFLFKTYLKAAMGLFAVFFIGLIINLAFFSSGILRVLANSKFNLDILKEIISLETINEELSRLGFLWLWGFALIIVSSILKLFWGFKLFWSKKLSSKTFIYFLSTIYILGQGVGLGMIIAVWNAWEILIAFLVAAIIFTAISLFGWTSKTISTNKFFPLPLMFVMRISMIILLPILILSVIFTFTGFFTFLSFIVFVLITILLPIFVLYDIWLIKNKMQKIQLQGSTKIEELNWSTFFALSILTDFLTMFYYILRLISYFRN